MGSLLLYSGSAASPLQAAGPVARRSLARVAPPGGHQHSAAEGRQAGREGAPPEQELQPYSGQYAMQRYGCLVEPGD